MEIAQKAKTYIEIKEKIIQALYSQLKMVVADANNDLDTIFEQY